ncbi:MAG: aminomethyl transferase family protein [Planctomycetia bacterium]|nr:aminomethyl transferase family protein [Planctomycetia bacterium]
MPPYSSPIAQSPLVDMHHRCGAHVERRDGWLMAVKYPDEPGTIGNALVDLAHRPTIEINGPDVATRLSALCGADVPVRQIRSADEWHAYRLTPGRAIVFGKIPRQVSDALDVTGGWVSLALWGPDAERLLNKITAVDLRERTLPVGGCCQGPIFGVNTLFGRFARRFELHVCYDSAEFLWEVLMDAGAEFHLKPAGIDYAARHFV